MRKIYPIFGILVGLLSSWGVTEATPFKKLLPRLAVVSALLGSGTYTYQAYKQKADRLLVEASARKDLHKEKIFDQEQSIIPSSSGLSAPEETKRVKELRRQAKVILPYLNEFNKCFKGERVPYELEGRYKACFDLQETLQKAGLIKKSSESGCCDKTNSDVSGRLKGELSLLATHMPHYYFENREHAYAYLHPSIQDMWRRGVMTAIENRRETLKNWPEDKYKEDPVGFVATVLNEFQLPCEEQKPYVDPKEFLSKKK